jgi:hypothetical protein
MLLREGNEELLSKSIVERCKSDIKKIEMVYSRYLSMNGNN